MAELSLWLDAYDDIFSDFDSRHYLKRRISEDFIEELRMSLKYRKDMPGELWLSLPSDKRNTDIEHETIISFTQQMRDRFVISGNSAKKILVRDLIMLICGLVVMASSSVIRFKSKSGYLPIVFQVILEPAGWFLIWNGLDSIINEYRKIKKEESFYKKLAQLKINFKNI